MVSKSPGSTKHVLCLPVMISEVTGCNARAQLVHTHNKAAEQTAGKAHADENFLAIVQCMHNLQMIGQAACPIWQALPMPKCLGAADQHGSGHNRLCRAIKLTLELMCQVTDLYGREFCPCPCGAIPRMQTVQSCCCWSVIAYMLLKHARAVLCCQLYVRCQN